MKDSSVLLHVKNYDGFPRVTIGMPTYRRANTIRRALLSISQQTYQEFVLLISDNAGDDPETLQAVEQLASQLPELVLFAQEQNLGALANFNFLLSTAKTEYFMWLADDDEITPCYLEELVALLDSDSSIVTAMGQWFSMKNPVDGYIRSQLRPSHRSRFLRLMHFVGGRADDSPFYGLHRTISLRRASFAGFWPPNQNVLTNCCYPFLFDLLLQGRFAYTDKAAWICHDYSEKHYAHAYARDVKDKIKTLVRRINVQAIYVFKAFSSAPWLAPPVFMAGIFGFLRELIEYLLRFLRAQLSRRAEL